MRLKFGVLDLGARQLERGNNVVPLEPKMYELLEVLIRGRPAVVTNNELDELLWPNVYVARTSLTRLVSELRAVLGDSPRDSRLIRTAYKVGYAVCADVTGLPAVRSSPATIEVLWMKQSFPLTDGEALAASVPVPIASIAIRACPTLPPTIEERIADNRAQVVADSVMYRQALAVAAGARGWLVYWYDGERVFRDAAAMLGCGDVNSFLNAMGRSVGAPWQAKHKIAAAAALAAARYPAP
jgi:DNA-binding winged helix-turn-helix (wHTH) protein